MFTTCLLGALRVTITWIKNLWQSRYVGPTLLAINSAKAGARVVFQMQIIEWASQEARESGRVCLCVCVCLCVEAVVWRGVGSQQSATDSNLAADPRNTDRPPVCLRQSRLADRQTPERRQIINKYLVYVQKQLFDLRISGEDCSECLSLSMSNMIYSRKYTVC